MTRFVLAFRLGRSAVECVHLPGSSLLPSTMHLSAPSTPLGEEGEHCAGFIKGGRRKESINGERLGWRCPGL